MRSAARAAVLLTAGLALLATAALHGLLNVPHLRGDLLETGVRPTVLGPVTLVLYFSVAAMVAFAGLVLRGAASARRGEADRSASLWIVAATYVVFGLAAFALVGRSPHFLGYSALGLLVGVGAAIRPAARDVGLRARA